VKRGKGGNGTDDNVWVTVGRYFGLLTAVPAAIFIGYLIGAWLDSQFSTHFLKVVFVILGTAAGFIPIFQELSKND
jgi:F0F1-type ATP synthase assembly protein I